MVLNNVPADYMVFRGLGGGEATYVVGADGLDFFAFREKFGPDAKSATGLNLEDGDQEGFWLVYVEDCFDPAVAVVRMDDPAAAEDTFVNELDWARVADGDTDDDPNDPNAHDRWNWSSDGHRYEGAAVKWLELTLTAVVL